MLSPVSGKDPERPLLQRGVDLGPWGLVLDLYRRNPAFRGFLEFALIGAVLLAFLSPVSFEGPRAWLERKISQYGTAALVFALSGEWDLDILAPGRNQIRFPLPNQIAIDNAAFNSSAPSDRQRLIDSTALYRARERAIALRILEPTDANDPNVQFMRGMLLIGRTQTTNVHKGAALLERAAIAGQIQAMTFLAMAKLSTLPEISRDEAGARQWLEKAADANDPAAAKYLAVGFINGLFGVADPRRAVHYYRIASQLGDLDAAFVIGTMLFAGQGVPKDEKEAELHIRRGAEGGHAGAQYALGQWLLSRYLGGWSDDPTEGVGWLTKSVEAGEQRAMHALGMFHVELAKTEPWRDPAKAFAMFERCAALWYPDCLFAYATALENGVGTQRNAPRAWAFYKFSNEADQGKGKAAARIAALEAVFIQEERDEAKHILVEVSRRKPPFALHRIGRDVHLSELKRFPDIGPILARYRNEIEGVEMVNPRPFSEAVAESLRREKEKAGR